MRRPFVWLGLLLLAIVVAIGFWRLGDNREASQAEFLMGTYMEVKAIGRNAPLAIEKAFARLKNIEERMTQNSMTSEVAGINQKAGIEPVTVSADTFYVIQKALHYAELTEGKFDPTIQPVVKLWQIGSPQARVPAPEEIAAKLQVVNYHAVELDAELNTVWLTQPGMGLDLGGIAKGYAADEVAAILREHGVKKALINLGGNLYALGNSPSGQPWRIGIQDPEDERSQYIAVIEANDRTLVTSGAYERFLKVDDKLYHHILNPATGYPATTDLLSVTIITTNSIDADALSTSVFILGLDDGLALVNRLPDIDAVLINKEHQVFATEGVRDRMTIVDPKYKLMPLK